MLILSLTTIPSRFGQIRPTLDSLLAQTARIDEIRLHIPRRYRRFPDYDGAVPDLPPGVTLIRPDEDLGPASKVLFAADDLRGTDCDILFCDDDRIYPRDWAAQMLRGRAEQPNACVAALGRETSDIAPSNMAHRAQPRAERRPWQQDYGYMLRHAAWEVRRRFPRPPDRPRRRVFRGGGFIDTFMGFGGVMVRPNHFDRTDWQIPEICWAVDDIWLSGALARKGVPIWIPSDIMEPVNTEAYTVNALFAAVLDGAGRRDAEAHCVKYMRDTHRIWS